MKRLGDTPNWFKVGLSPKKKKKKKKCSDSHPLPYKKKKKKKCFICFHENSLKMMKNNFCLILKAVFVRKNGLIRKIRLI